MNIKDLTTILLPMVLLAFIISISSEFCQLTQANQFSIMGNNQSLDPFCYVKTFNPEPPKLKIPNPIDGGNKISSVSFSANASGTSQYYSFNPSFEAPEES